MSEQTNKKDTVRIELPPIIEPGGPAIIRATPKLVSEQDVLAVEWAGAVAPNATIRFVAVQSSNSTDGAQLAAQHIVDHNLAPIMAVCSTACENGLGAAGCAFWRNLWAQAAAQGISVFAASGNKGPDGCEDGTGMYGHGRAVSGIGSTPFNLAVGGTQFDEGSGTYWGPVQADGSSALGYIPERAWNESAFDTCGSGTSGGGFSCCWSRPSWQAALGVPTDERHRYVPDVSLAAAAVHDPFPVVWRGSLVRTGGTAFATSAMAGLMALVVQSTGDRQGNPGPILYRLAAHQYRGAGPAVFHDIVAGANDVPGVPGWPCTPGYDLATGLGSPDPAALVEAWDPGLGNNVDTAIQQPGADPAVLSGTEVAFQGTARMANGSPLTYAWDFGDGATAGGISCAHVFQAQGQAPERRLVTFTATDGMGGSCSDTRTVKVVPAPAPGERIVNGGFESGSAGWTCNSMGIASMNGNWEVHLGDDCAQFQTSPWGSDQVLKQVVRIPDGATSARLSFWLLVEVPTVEPPVPSAGGVVDTFQMKVRGADCHVAILGTWSNLDDLLAYQQHALDLSAYQGQEVQLEFVAPSSPHGVYTMFYLDDVSLIAK